MALRWFWFLLLTPTFSFFRQRSRILSKWGHVTLLDLDFSTLWIKDSLQPLTVSGVYLSSTSVLLPIMAALRPFHYSLHTFDCVAIKPANTLTKLVDDATVVGPMKHSDETQYRKETNWLTSWCHTEHKKRWKSQLLTSEDIVRLFFFFLPSHEKM